MCLNNSIQKHFSDIEYQYRYKLGWDIDDLIIKKIVEYQETNSTFLVLVKKDSFEIIGKQQVNQLKIFQNAKFEVNKFIFSKESNFSNSNPFKFIYVKVPEKDNKKTQKDVDVEILQQIDKKIDESRIPRFKVLNSSLSVVFYDRVKLSGNLSTLLSGGTELYIDNSNVLKLTDKLSIVNYAAIYTNIISEQYFGDSLAPVLRCINLVQTDENHIVSYFDNPVYVPVNKSLINSINIKIVDLEGNFIQFKDEYAFVILTLHFKKK